MSIRGSEQLTGGICSGAGCINVGGLKFLVARLLDVPLHKQHLLIVAPSAASSAAPDSRHVSSLIDAKEVDTLQELGIEVPIYITIQE